MFTVKMGPGSRWSFMEPMSCIWSQSTTQCFYLWLRARHGVYPSAHQAGTWFLIHFLNSEGSLGLSLCSAGRDPPCIRTPVSISMHWREFGPLGMGCGYSCVRGHHQAFLHGGPHVTVTKIHSPWEAISRPMQKPSHSLPPGLVYHTHHIL